MPAELIINQGRENETRIRIIDVHPLRAGDRVTLRTSGAGGYGDPYLREPDAVLADVISGLVSIDQARDAYGVIISDNKIDLTSTTSRRSGRKPNARWDPGPERACWSDVFDPTTLDTLADQLAQLPIFERAQTRRRLIQQVLSQLPDGFPAVAADPTTVTAARARLAELTDELRVARARIGKE